MAYTGVFQDRKKGLVSGNFKWSLGSDISAYSAEYFGAVWNKNWYLIYCLIFKFLYSMCYKEHSKYLPSATSLCPNSSYVFRTGFTRGLRQSPSVIDGSLLNI